jgi:hypothetical protein
MWDQHSSDGMFMGDQTAIDQRSEQTITRGHAGLRNRTANRGGRLALVAASIACMPALLGCSSSMSSDWFHSSRSSSPPAQAVASPPPAMPGPTPVTSTATAGTQLAGVSPPGVAFARVPLLPLTTAARSPVGTAPAAAYQPPAASSVAAAAPAASDDDFDAAASAYPSVALFDIFRRDAQEAAASANPPVPSNSAAQTATPAAPGQPAAAGQAAPAAPGGTAAAAPSSAASASTGDYDAAASAYPSVSLHDLILGPRSSTN